MLDISASMYENSLPYTYYLLAGLHGFQESLLYTFMHTAILQAKPAQQASCKLAANLMK